MIKILNFILFLYANFALATQHPRPMAGEPRIKVINYNSNAIHYYLGFYGYQSSILFNIDETISTISMGNSTGWQLIPQNNRLFLKPLNANAETNATIITNRRIYHFELHAEEASSVNDPKLSYETRFLYLENTGITGTRNYASTSIPDITETNNLNFNYTISGSEKISPTMVFDDGEFTYLRFKSINAELPAIFEVDNQGYESIINYKSIDDYIVIERVSAVFTLRAGSEVACLFNETIPFHKKEVKKRKKGILQKRRKT
ncbi:type IV secretion system protein VirB9 [Candidatus Xenohaliotis californiensis]|uniref:Type IV secretion system protein VirB9 n=1 Tax=Candidatus Xenohaliotis californiensis TaxID=84677 RepID=A0ABP0ETJ1_9RICK|nr:type IV secretion system protein VirB9 [Candidatus Xenohaliotis californiensis]